MWPAVASTGPRSSHFAGVLERGRERRPGGDSGADRQEDKDPHIESRRNRFCLRGFAGRVRLFDARTFGQFRSGKACAARAECRRHRAASGAGHVREGQGAALDPLGPEAPDPHPCEQVPGTLSLARPRGHATACFARRSWPCLPPKRRLQIADQIRFLPRKRTRRLVRRAPEMPIGGRWHIDRPIKLEVLANAARRQVHQLAQHRLQAAPPRHRARCRAGRHTPIAGATRRSRS